MRNVETSGFTGYDLGYLNVPLLWSPDGWGLFVHSGEVEGDGVASLCTAQP